MKLYFFKNMDAMVAEFEKEPECLASFSLKEGESKFTPRYALVEGELVDNFPDKTDEEVAQLLQLAAEEEALALESKFKVEQVDNVRYQAKYSLKCT